MSVMPAARLAWGVMLAGAPGTVLEAVTGRPATTPRTRVLRVLGTRHLLQGSLDLARPTPGALRSGVAVDLLHAATCAGAVAFSPGWRRIAALDGAGAVAFAIGGLIRAHRMA
jgi:hypothetical protein